MADPQEFDTSLVDASSRKRSIGREVAMKLLYMMDMRGKDEVARTQQRFFHFENERFARALERKGESINHEDRRESEEFGKELYQGVLEVIDNLDITIQAVADNWNLRRMAFVDRALLRIGTYELLHRFDIPPRVSISEAIELAKKYSTDKSSSFINGILDKIYQEHCAEKE